MRHLYNYVFMFLALVISIYLGLRIAQPEIVGHWHVSQTMGTDEHELEGIRHFNVYANGEVVLNETEGYRYSIGGTVDRLSRQMNLGGECWYVSADYHVSGNRMEITGGGEYGPAWKAIAFRTEPGDCDVERDYFAGLPLDIRLPQYAYDLLDELEYSYEDISFYIGQNKARRGVSMLAERFFEINDLETLQQYVRGRDQLGIDSFTSRRKIIVYQDAEADADKYLELLRQQFSEINGLEGYYQVHRAVDSPGLDLNYRWVPFNQDK